MMVRASHEIPSATNSRNPTRTNTRIQQQTAPITTEMLKLSASFAWLATNAVRSRLTSHTTSGPSTMPMGGTMKKEKADRCAIIPQVRSSCVGGVPGGTGGADGASSLFVPMLLPGVRALATARDQL